MAFDDLGSRLIVGRQDGFGLRDNDESPATVVDDLVHVEMSDSNGNVFFEGNTRQRNDRTFFHFFELDDTGKTVITANWTEQYPDGSRCPRLISRTVTSIRKLYLPSRCDVGTYRPRSVILICADPGFQLRRVSWRRWNRAVVIGRGTARVNTCVPACAAGRFLNYKVTLRGFRVRDALTPASISTRGCASPSRDASRQGHGGSCSASPARSRPRKAETA